MSICQTKIITTRNSIIFTNTDNCTNCWYGCDHSSGNCSGQCAHGFFGPKCEQECPQCLDCDKLSGDCVSCHDRHYGKRCEFKCNENCMVGCRISGDCYKCNEGFYGMTCNLTCPSPNCRNGCERHTGNCTGWGCDSGFWGTMCNKSCPQNCGFTSCHQKDGTCQTCKDGYSGKTCEERCNYEHCSLCQFDVTTCFNCYHGWWGEHCDKKCTEHCSHPYCSQHTGKCGKCDHGYHGPYCEGTCNSVCETCSDNNTCDTCKTGFYGEDCKQRCPIRCTDCERDGKCKVCNSGYFGEECRCELSQCASNKESFCSSCKNETSWYPQEKGCCPCSDYCSSNSGDLLCNQTGCINECKDGYFGKHCLEPCSEHCLEGVKETCNNETGECQNGCKKGWHLPNCDYNCSLHFPHCNSCKEYLDNKNKPYVVCETCELGYYKELYSGLCKPCEHCQGGNMCDGTIGYCKWGCQKGWYAKREHYLCENPCPDNCTGGICEEIGGKCKTGCRPGSYGPHCLILCPSGCLNSTCEFRSGKCVLGCVPGQRGAYCNESCNAQCGVRGCREDDGLCKAFYWAFKIVFRDITEINVQSHAVPIALVKPVTRQGFVQQGVFLDGLVYFVKYLCLHKVSKI
ncbi:multiple epidermal growth factor-like domains protein 10 [Saccostrea echinata]|uniref:multiple epidermal growth factor-like domains protein 10 n=1 Tax=Saccostrea echinata TaxID=191078 RepID=UPI002A7F4B11|nr:multiple epidermal growth factor-like domains protein 10 [Saccostrea echinata]